MEGVLPFTPGTATTCLSGSMGAGLCLAKCKGHIKPITESQRGVRGSSAEPCLASLTKSKRQAHLLGEKFHADGTSTQHIPAEERLVSCAWQKLTPLSHLL